MTGVVMMGGQSSRMGTDKSMLLWAGQPLYRHFFSLLQTYCEKVVLSVNRSQQIPANMPFQVVEDQQENQGPMGGLISCYQSTGDALLVVAVDTPLVGKTELDVLLRLHSRLNGCTVFYNDTANKYEPMPAVWEKEMLDELKQAYLQGHRSLQYFLKEKAIEKFSCPFLHKLVSANTPDSWQEMLRHQSEEA